MAALPGEAPPRARIAELTRESAEPEGATGFAILESAAVPGEYQLVSPDIATCDDCRRELLDPHDRRYALPLHQLHQLRPPLHHHRGPALRPRAHDDAAFPMCPACRREYEDPLDRRFHAEPTACPVCGPRRRAAERAPDGARVVRATGTPEDPAAPVRAAAALLRDGEIVAIKGLGGFHLACDATDGDAVRRLKSRKRRPHKPLAVMVAGIDELRRHCRVTAPEEELLMSPEHPIVLLEWRDIGPAGELGPELGDPAGDGASTAPADPDQPAAIDPEVAVGQRYLGVMLPYTPLHILLLREAGRPLVMTSGNLAEEPMVKDWDEIEPPGGHRRRVPGARPGHRRALRRLGRAGARRAAAARAPGAGLCPVPPAPPAAPAPGAGLRRGAQEHLLPDARRQRLPQPAHRRPGEPGDAGELRGGHRRLSSGSSTSTPRWWPTTCTPSTSGPSTRWRCPARRWRCSTITPTWPRRWWRRASRIP